MKTKYAALLVLILLGLYTTACSKDTDDEIGLQGRWVEEAPVEDRTELYFYDKDKLVRSNAEGNIEDYFYRIQDTTIYIRAQANIEDTTQLFFRRVDKMTLQIENLYPSIPETGTSYMIFKRQ